MRGQGKWQRVYLVLVRAHAFILPFFAFVGVHAFIPHYNDCVSEHESNRWDRPLCCVAVLSYAVQFLVLYLCCARARGELVVCLWCSRARGVLVVCLCCGRARGELVVCLWYARARGVLVVCLWCARARGVLVVCLCCAVHT